MPGSMARPGAVDRSLPRESRSLCTDVRASLTSREARPAARGAVDLARSESTGMVTLLCADQEIGTSDRALSHDQDSGPRDSS